MSNTYTKLKSGAWGIRAAGKVSDGAIISVAKKDGSTKQEIVEKVLWTGKDNKTGETISLCAIAQRAMGAAGGGYISHRSRSRYGCSNGQCYCPHCCSGSECLCHCSCGFGG